MDDQDAIPLNRVSRYEAATGIEALWRAARECRRLWRWHWERFWLLRWENAVRRPAWRVEEEARAWRRMREEVQRYARLRLQIAALSGARSPDADGIPAGIQESLTTIHR